LGIPRGKYVVKVNNRKVLEGIRESEGIADDKQWHTALRALDKLDRLEWDGVERLLGPGRKDESGDFTPGAGLSVSTIYNMKAFIEGGLPVDCPLTVNSARPMSDMKSNYPNTFADILYGLDHWQLLFGGTNSGRQGLNELIEIIKLCETAGYGSLRICVDPSVVRGLEYYTGPVFEVELTFPIEDEKGNAVRFGSVGGGGRYDGLVARFRGEPVPATGFSIGVSRLLAALRHLGKIEDKPAPGPVVVTVFDRERIADYQRMVQRLRDAPLDPNRPDGPRIRAELYLGNPRNFGNQLKYADRRNSPCVVIQGGDEKNMPTGPHVLVKDLIVGAELAKLEKGREEHLQRQAEAQRLVPEGELVDAVRAVLSRHDVTWE
jgi:histidyl-tRNA synthetase